MNIDADKYTVVILQYRLVSNAHKQTIGEDTAFEDYKDVTYLQVPGIAYQRQEANQMLFKEGDAGSVYNYPKNVGYSTLGEKGSYAYAYPVVVTPWVFVHKEGSKWYLYADYPNLSPKSFNYKKATSYHRQLDTSGSGVIHDAEYEWKVDLLLIDNKYIKDFGDIEINEKKDSNNKSTITNSDDLLSKLGVLASQ